MVKKYTSKYSGAQIDEAVKAIIENVVSLEDLDPALIEEIKKWIADAKEVIFIPREEFPTEGSDSYLYLATDESILYYWDGEEYKAVTSTDYYTKEEVDKLLEAIEGSIPVDTNTTYTIEVDGETITLVSKELDEEEWKNVKVINFKDMFDPLYDTKDAAKNALADANKYTDEQIAAEAERANDLYETIANATIRNQEIEELKLAVDSISGISGAFIFKGEVDSIEDLPTTSAENTGHVYIVSKKEYVSDGTKWIELGDEGAYVLKSVYDAHLAAQLEIDKAQNEAIVKKVDGIEGKGLSTNDFTDDLLNKLESLENYDDEGISKSIEEIQEALDNKVEKVEGKGLSTNDFTTALLEKLNSLENYDDSSLQQTITGLSGDVANKVDIVEGKGLSTNDFTNELLGKLNGLENYDDTAIKESIPTKISELTNDAGYIRVAQINTNSIQGIWKFDMGTYKEDSFPTIIYDLKYNGNISDSDGNEYEAISFSYTDMGTAGIRNEVSCWKKGATASTRIFKITYDSILSGLAVNADTNTLRDDYTLTFRDGDWAPADKARNALELIDFCAEKIAELDGDNQLDIDSLVTKDDLEDYAKLEDIDDIDLTYTNLTPTEITIGGIDSGTTFDNMSIQDVLTRLLYPYIEMEVGSVTCSGATPGSFYVHNLPILKSVAIEVTKNHAKDLSFKLMSGTTQYGNTLTENDIANGRLTFTNLGTYTDGSGNTQDGLVIDVTKTFTIEYSYTGKTGNKNSSKNVGTFTISFQNPSTPTISTNLGSSNLSKYTGQTAELSKIEAKISNLYSAAATGGITKLELLKDDEVIETLNSPTTYVFTHTADITNTTKYKVKMWFNTRTGSSTTTSSTSIESSEWKITFTYQNPTISMSSSGTTNYSVLNKLTIPTGTIKASVTKNSANISSVKLFNGSEDLETKTPTSLNTDVHSSSSTTVTFDYAVENSYNNYNFTAKAYYNDGSDKTITTSSSKKYELYYPHCWGFVDGDVTLSSVGLTELQTIATQNESQYATSTIVLDEPKEQQKLLYMTHTGNYSKIIDESTGFEETSGYEIGTKNITFGNGVTKTYYVYIWKTKSKSAVNSSFQ